MNEVIEVLKQEEKKYRDRDKIGLEADAFKLAIDKIESKGLTEAYHFFKRKKDEFANKPSVLASRLSHSYGLVVGKLWKFYSHNTEKLKEGENGIQNIK